MKSSFGPKYHENFDKFLPKNMKGVEIIKIKTIPYTTTIYIWLYGLFNVFKDISLMIWPLFRSLGRNLSNFLVVFWKIWKIKKTFRNYLTFTYLVMIVSIVGSPILSYFLFSSKKTSNALKLDLYKQTTKIMRLCAFTILCPIHVVTFTLISNLATDYIQKRRGEPGLFSFEYNLSLKLISK